MTVKELTRILQILPEDCVVMSNSGWECDPTDIGAIWYNKDKNEAHLTQGGFGEMKYGYEEGFYLLWYVEE